LDGPVSRILLLFVSLLAAVACDRTTPSATPAPTRSSTPSVAISTVEPSATVERTVAPEGMPGPPSDARRSRVLRVTDGDTVVLSGLDVGEIDRSTGGRKSRLIGIDTPEVFGRAECFGREASAFTRRTLDGRDVLVDLDVDPVDRYGRALVYIWLADGTFFNGLIVAEGYASQATFPPNVRYADLFGRLAREARGTNRGLWSAC
jgi:micrococcal nuclease